LDLVTACGIQDNNLTALKQKWTLLQIHPEVIVNADIFCILSERLNNVETGLLATWVEEIITTISTKIRGPRLYLVLDEAQAISSSYDTHFHSGNGSSSRSILKYLLQAWDVQYELHLLISGTGLSLDIIRKSHLCTHVATPIPTWNLSLKQVVLITPLYRHVISPRGYGPGSRNLSFCPVKKHFLDVVGAGSVAGESIFLTDATVSQILCYSHQYTTGFVQIL